jgi:hypothetical protein
MNEYEIKWLWVEYYCPYLPSATLLGVCAKVFNLPMYFLLASHGGTTIVVEEF